MKYEFHVGDYVETKNGSVGYITTVKESKASHWKVTNASYKDINLQNYYTNEEYVIWEPIDNGDFIRIGQYDFTKKDKDKIAPLDYTERFIRESTIDTTLVSYMKKINELVEAVNRLDKNVEDHLQYHE